MAARIVEQLFDDWCWRLPAESRYVALTCDDGPDPRTTPRLLRALSELPFIATMFLTGARCAALPSLVKEIGAAGHDVANHGYEHQSLRFAGGRRVMDSIERTRAAIAATGVTTVKWFRPPYGAFNPWTRRAVQARGLEGAMWSVMVPDWCDTDFQRLRRRLDAKLHSGAIVVLHDGHEQAIERTIGLVSALAERATREGWRVGPLPPSPPSITAPT